MLRYIYLWERRLSIISDLWEEFQLAQAVSTPVLLPATMTDIMNGHFTWESVQAEDGCLLDLEEWETKANSDCKTVLHGKIKLNHVFWLLKMILLKLAKEALSHGTWNLNAMVSMFFRIIATCSDGVAAIIKANWLSTWSIKN